MVMPQQTQAFMQPAPTEEDAKQAFESGFSDMAYNILNSKFPELMENVAAFKIVKSEINDGSAVGAFMLVRNGVDYIVPVILANNQIKPVEILFAKEKNMFLPLKKAWLNELDRENVGNMGEGVKPPSTMQNDVDIRKLVVPPSTGRYGYASVDKGGTLIRFLHEAPNTVKLAFTKILERSPKILKYAFTVFDREDLLCAIEPDQITKKVAALPASLVEIFSTDNSAEQFRDVFGDRAADAFQKAAQEGYAVKDKRIVANVAIDTEEPGQVTEAKESGFYRVQLADGTFKQALVIAHPQSLYPKYMIFTEDGELFTSGKVPIGHKLNEEDLKGRLSSLKSGKSSAIQGTGFFVNFEGGKIRATAPFTALRTTTGSDKTRRIHTYDGVLITKTNAPGKAIHAPADSGITYIPESYKFIKCKREYGPDLQNSADEHLQFQNAVSKHASYAVKIKDVGAGMFTINTAEQLNKLGSLQSLILTYGLRLDDAESLLEKTAEKRHHSVMILKPMGFLNFVKEAQGMMAPQQQQPAPAAPAAPPPQGAPAPQGTPAPGGQNPAMNPSMMDPSMMDPSMMDPSMMDPSMMDPSMMMPPEPPPPSPVDLAVVELSSELAQQSADVAEQLAEQQRDLATHLQILEAVKHRADQISAEQMAPMGPDGLPMPPEMPMDQMGPNSDQMAEEAMPYMDEAADLDDPDAFESTAIGSLAASSDFPSLVANYIPNLEEALDNLGRLLLSLWMQEKEFQQTVGEVDYIDLEEKLRNVFNNMGSLILRINQTAMMTAPNDETEA